MPIGCQATITRETASTYFEGKLNQIGKIQTKVFIQHRQGNKFLQEFNYARGFVGPSIWSMERCNIKQPTKTLNQLLNTLISYLVCVLKRINSRKPVFIWDKNILQ